MPDAPKPDERYAYTELRYRIADAINDWLKAIPFVHSVAKNAAKWAEHRRSVKLAARQHPVANSDRAPQPKLEAGPRASASMPIPPVEMRQLVGPADIATFDNPSGSLVYPWLPESAYKSVFDFGCGCGRVARQLILQRPSPTQYVGIDLNASMIEWCNNNLRPVAPNFTFYHHDVFNVLYNPGSEKPLTAPFPVQDLQFTLINALSVFTHLTQDQAEYYLRECRRILSPDGILHASWFLFDKPDYPMMSADFDALYVSYIDPSAAVIFDRKWLRDTARAMGLRIFQVRPPEVHGHQWLVLMTRRTDVPEIELPPDTAPRGSISPGF